MTINALKSSTAAIPGVRTLTAVFVALTLAGCAGNPSQFPTGIIDITVKPGDTGDCESTPCQVKLVMPAGKGSYEVTGNEVRVGTYPAGQTVNLGNFWQSQKFTIVGAGVPPVYVYIPTEM
jgi:hypothetical protein